MKKAIAAVSLCVALTFCMSLSAFAATVDITHLFSLNEASVIGSDGEWYKKTDLTWQYDNSTSEPRMVAAFGADLAHAPYRGFRLKFGGRPMQDNLLISAGYYAVLTISVRDIDISNSSELEGERYCNVSVFDDIGNLYTIRTTPVFTTYNNGSLITWNASLVGQIGDGERSYIQTMVIESNMPSANLGNDAYNISFRFQIAETATEAQRILEEQKKAIEDAADQISGSIDDAADNIINDDLGYQEDPDQTDAKNGIQAIKVKIDSLSEDIDESVDDFSASIDGLKTSINSGKTFVWGWLDYVPVWVTAIIVGFAGILIARKVVK